MVNYNARRIMGRWKQGFALDLHTISSVPLGYNEFGHMQFETTRTELGDLLYRLKYASEIAAVDEIANAAADFFTRWRPPCDILIPVPPSTQRSLQPVLLIARAISDRTRLPLRECIRATRPSQPLKDVYGLEERLRLLEGLYEVDRATTSGKRVLLFDDLYRSGATLNAAAEALYDTGEAAEVFALTITETRSNQ
ncbi:MAG TPA: hypothetical protein VIN40_04895 [Candidatus Tyrphobacter sp.]